MGGAFLVGIFRGGTFHVRAFAVGTLKGGALLGGALLGGAGLGGLFTRFLHDGDWVGLRRLRTHRFWQECIEFRCGTKVKYCITGGRG